VIEIFHNEVNMIAVQMDHRRNQDT
jgi:hypothetical protein